MFEKADCTNIYFKFICIGNVEISDEKLLSFLAGRGIIEKFIHKCKHIYPSHIFYETETSVLFIRL